MARVFPGRHNGFDVAVYISRGRCRISLTSQFLFCVCVAGAMNSYGRFRGRQRSCARCLDVSVPLCFPLYGVAVIGRIHGRNNMFTTFCTFCRQVWEKSVVKRCCREDLEKSVAARHFSRVSVVEKYWRIILGKSVVDK